jgi:hypothetical protein
MDVSLMLLTSWAFAFGADTMYVHCNPDGSASDWAPERVCCPAEARKDLGTQGLGPKGLELLGLGGREETLNGSPPPHAADARDGLWYQAVRRRRCNRAGWGGLSVGPLGECIPFLGQSSARVAAHALQCRPPTVQNDADDISHAGLGAGAHWSYRRMSGQGEVQMMDGRMSGLVGPHPRQLILSSSLCDLCTTRVVPTSVCTVLTMYVST